METRTNGDEREEGGGGAKTAPHRVAEWGSECEVEPRRNIGTS